jgi:hypothetical protein
LGLGSTWHELVCHAYTPPGRVAGVRFSIELRELSASLNKQQILLGFLVDAEPADVRVASPAKPYRTDGLWETTCFELFLQGRRHSYVELNFSPSSQWAAYNFASYREGMEALDLDPPMIGFWTDDGQPYISITIDLPIQPCGAVAVSAVIEETDGTKSYWALAHPPGPPDFHHPDCFALTLAAPEPS